MSQRWILFCLPFVVSTSLQGEVASPRAPIPSLGFVENRGQWDEGVRFSARRGGLTVDFEERAMRLKGLDVRLVFEVASSTLRLEGEGEAPGRTAFFRGKDPAAWRAGARSFRSILYRGLYDCIDLRVREAGHMIEYDLLLEPGANPACISIRCEGAESLEIQGDGSLAIHTSSGAVLQPPPATWRELESGRKRPLTCRYRLLGDDSFGFDLEAEELSDPIVIDPQLGYLGSGGSDTGFSIALGKDGAIYVAAEMGGFGFPVPDGFPDIDPKGSLDAFIGKLTPDASRLIWSAVLGGVGDDRPIELKVDDSGFVTVAGGTSSPDFPATPNAFDEFHNGGNDAFVARLNPDPSLEPNEQLLYSSFLGGQGDDLATALELDREGNAHTTGSTASWDFPTTEGAYNETSNGGRDVFYAKLVPDVKVKPEKQLVYSTYLGGGGHDTNDFGNNNIYFLLLHQNLALGSDGRVVLAGSTASSDFPVTPGAIQESHGGGYVTVLKPDRALPPEEQLVASTFLGGEASAVSILEGGDIAVAGSGGSFFHRLSPGLDQVVHTSTFSGNRTWVAAWRADGSVVFGGRHWGDSIPTTPGAIKTLKSGNSDAFFTILDPSLPAPDQLRYSTMFGGGGEEEPYSIVLDPEGAALLCGWTYSSDFTQGANTFGFQDAPKGGFDEGFIARFDLRFPKAFFTATPEVATAPLSVTVDASASTTPPGTSIVSYEWDFGDGAAVSGAAASHTYESPGMYTVILKVKNDAANYGTSSRAITASCPRRETHPWIQADIGEPAFPGGARPLQEGNGMAFELCAGGKGSMGKTDQLFFLHKQFSKDVTITAQVEKRAGKESAQAGLMLRDGLDPTAPFAAIVFNGSSTGNSGFLFRSAPGKFLGPFVRGPHLEPAAAWLRLERKGNRFIGSTSMDGQAWSILKEVEMDLPEVLLGGVSAEGKYQGEANFPALRVTVADLRVEETEVPLELFRRGDVDSNKTVEITDAVRLLGYLFLGEAAATCPDAADADDNGVHELTDGVIILGYLFLGQEAPSAPGPTACGPDPAGEKPDELPPCREVGCH